MYTCSKSYYIRFSMYICLLLFSITLLVSHFVPPCEVSEGIVCVFADSYFASVSIVITYH